MANPVDLQHYIGDLGYPASKDELLRHARGEGATEDILRVLRDLPGERFSSPAEVTEAVGNPEASWWS